MESQKIKKGLKLEDYEDAVLSAANQLFIMYKYNGGQAAERSTLVLLDCINKQSTYLEELVLAIVEATKNLGDQEAKILLDKIQPLMKVIKQGEGNGK